MKPADADHGDAERGLEAARVLQVEALAVRPDEVERGGRQRTREAHPCPAPGRHVRAHALVEHAGEVAPERPADHGQPGLVVPDRDLDPVDALLLHHPRDLDQLVGAQAAPQREVVGAVQLQDDGAAVVHPLADGAMDLDQQAQAARERPAVLVAPAVRVRREELVDQVPVGRVDLDAVEPGLAAAPGGGGEALPPPRGPRCR